MGAKKSKCRSLSDCDTVTESLHHGEKCCANPILSAHCFLRATRARDGSRKEITLNGRTFCFIKVSVDAQIPLTSSRAANNLGGGRPTVCKSFDREVQCRAFLGFKYGHLHPYVCECSLDCFKRWPQTLTWSWTADDAQCLALELERVVGWPNWIGPVRADLDALSAEVRRRCVPDKVNVFVCCVLPCHRPDYVLTVITVSPAPHHALTARPVFYSHKPRPNVYPSVDIACAKAVVDAVDDMSIFHEASFHEHWLAANTLTDTAIRRM